MRLRELPTRVLNSHWLTLVNALLCIAAVWMNMRSQYFCRPVLWATVVLVLAFLPVVFFPLFKERLKQSNVVFFLFGVAACICVYCILFLGTANGVVPLIPIIVWMMPMAILAALPHFLLLQIMVHLYHAAGMRKLFAMGVAVCMVPSIAMAVWFDRNYDAVEAAIEDPIHNAALLEPDYITERMLGMHFKYHTSLCTFDGWRPPLHDPLIVVAAWLNFSFMDNAAGQTFRRTYFRGSRGSPFVSMGPIHLEGRIAAYKRVFPENPIRQKCSCAKGYSTFYLNDPRLERTLFDPPNRLRISFVP